MAIGVIGAKYSIQPFKTKTPKWINWSEIFNALFYVSMKMHVHCTFCCSINLNKSLTKFLHNTITILELSSRCISTTQQPASCYKQQPAIVMIPLQDSFESIRRKIYSPIFPSFHSETRKGWRELWNNTTDLTRTYKTINSWLNNFKVFTLNMPEDFQSSIIILDAANSRLCIGSMMHIRGALKYSSSNKQQYLTPDLLSISVRSLFVTQLRHFIASLRWWSFVCFLHSVRLKLE